jgi:hypothetical protein
MTTSLHHHARLAVFVAAWLALSFAAALAANDYRFDRADYGQRIEGVEGDPAVWWCEATWKIAKQRALPNSKSPAALLDAAKNDFQAVQVVVRPTKALKKLTAAATDLLGPGGAVIPAKDIRILQVGYHYVHTPTDRTGVIDWWPDALPPLDHPIDLAPAQNQPLWVLVHVAKEAVAGDYTGSVNLTAEGWNAIVPLHLHIWNFALPEKNHIATAFRGAVDDTYLQLKTESDKRQAWDLLWQAFAEHRMSAQIPTPMDPIEVKFVCDADPPRVDVDFTAFDAAMARAIEKFHFTNFNVPVVGLGGRHSMTGEDRPHIGPFEADTPQYESLFASQVQQIEKHLREKGWLDMTYVYWCDEPDRDIYQKVQAGVARLKKYAPGLNTFITLNRADSSLEGLFDIRCPVSPHYNQTVADARRATGVRYWWYICCGPKAPFCSTFVDHPATELRTWLWQTWQRNIVGVLIWHTTYWKTRPDGFDDPYEDPMCYVKGFHPIERRYYGNGDGRFFYPPVKASVPGKSGAGPILEPPVSSIRVEMLREGIEDYEFFWLLRDLIEKKRSSLSPEQVKAYKALLETPAEITANMTSFTTDARLLDSRRAVVAEAIEQLSK